MYIHIIKCIEYFTFQVAIEYILDLCGCTVHICLANMHDLFYLKGQSHEIKVWLFWAQWTEKILLIFPRKGFSS